MKPTRIIVIHSYVSGNVAWGLCDSSPTTMGVIYRMCVKRCYRPAAHRHCCSGLSYPMRDVTIGNQVVVKKEAYTQLEDDPHNWATSGNVLARQKETRYINNKVVVWGVSWNTSFLLSKDLADLALSPS